MSTAISKSILIIALIQVLTSKIVQVPRISSDQSLTLRLQQISQIDQTLSVFGKLNRIYKKEVYQIVDGKQTEFEVCSQQPPEAIFWGYSTRGISNTLKHNQLVYNFQDIKYPRNLIDISVYKNKLYYILENGHIKIDQIDQNFLKINSYKEHQTNQTKISKGNFVILPSATNDSAVGYGLFINNNQAQLFSLNTDNFFSIGKYPIQTTFQSAIALENNYFAVAYGESGLKILSINFSDLSLKVQIQVNNENSGISNLNVKDLAYDSARKILFIVDHSTGVLSLQLIYSKTGLTSKLTSSAIKNRLCNLIYYDHFNEELYLNCRQLHKYRINNWPIVDEKVLPKQEISIRQIISTPRLVALVGRDVFQIISADRKTAIYQDRLLDKLILTEKYFISANENSLMIGNYVLMPPTLTCSTSNHSYVGNHRLLIKVVAQCNNDYFAQINYQPGQLANDDKCVYSIYQNMQIWQPAVINTMPFMVVGIIVGVLGVGILIWWAFSFLSLRKLKNYLDNYHDLEEEGDKGTDGEQEKKVSQLQIEMPKEFSGTNQKFEGQDSLKQQQNNNNNLHDIQ